MALWSTKETTEPVMVPLAVYERECARADAAEARADYLMKQMVALKRKGYELGAEPKPGRVVPPPPDPEAKAAKRMHDALLESVVEAGAKELAESRGIPLEQARAEIAKIRDQAFGVDGVLPV